jgi:hypothetical protein
VNKNEIHLMNHSEPQNRPHDGNGSVFINSENSEGPNICNWGLRAFSDGGGREALPS